MNVQTIHPGEFLSAVTPLLEQQDLCGLLTLLKARWSPDQITSVLNSTNEDARKVAALALSLVGGACCVEPLSEKLKDPDPVVNEMAEHALWSIWFRSGCPQANQELNKGARALGQREFDKAVLHFTRAIEIDPKFPEAYNQRAIASYLQDKYEESISDCRKTIKLMPCHFGAWAGMGHCLAHEGRLKEALQCYQKALSINPHLECVEEACQEISRQLEED